MSKLTLETEGEKVVVVKRRFEAPPRTCYARTPTRTW